MRLYFDTSALLKRYICEIGSENVDNLFQSATAIYISIIGQIEAISCIRRLLLEKELLPEDYNNLKDTILQDFQFFNTIEISGSILHSSIDIIDKYQLKSLDSIHLATALTLRGQIDHFVSCDVKLLNAAKKEHIKTVHPNH